VVTSPSTLHASFLTLHLRHDANEQTTRHACASFPRFIASFPADVGKIYYGLALGCDLCRRWLKCSPPRGLVPFHSFVGSPDPQATQAHHEKALIPATGGDIFLHIKTDREDICFDIIKHFIKQCGGCKNIKRAIETKGFLYQPSRESGLGRDLTGFEDGTENPRSLEEKARAAIISEEDDKQHVGGSFVLTQKWVHDLERFESLPLSEQERVIGRTKQASIELNDAEKPSDAHISRVSVEDEKGEEMEIVRQSMSYGKGSSRKQGLFFIAYSNTLSKFEVMLSRMVGAHNNNNNNDGIKGHDRLMTYSTCVLSNWYYVPTMHELTSLEPSCKL
jgi:putative iron-dependent peroxidase